MKKSIYRILCFIVILTLCLGYLNSIFKFKYEDGIYNMKKYYELDENTVDVLILGSSHAFENINTGTLWEEYGMASFIIGGAIQPLWNTYYYLKEALKTQKPKLIVLEGYCTALPDEDYLGDSYSIKSTYGLKLSLDKINAIKESVSPEKRANYFLSYTQYHSRYKEINATDFLEDQGSPYYYNWKGTICNPISQSITPANDISNVTEKNRMTPKSEKYYRKIIALAQENNIPIVVVITPYSGITNEQQAIFNTASDIAAEYNVPFLNCNLLTDKIGLDYENECDAADYEHLNYKGNQKLSLYLGKYINSNYEIPDRRNDANYYSWELDSEYIKEIIYNCSLSDEKNFDAILSYC